MAQSSRFDVLVVRWLMIPAREVYGYGDKVDEVQGMLATLSPGCPMVTDCIICKFTVWTDDT